MIVDAAVELASHGHNVRIFTAHHDKNRCFEETVSGEFLLFYLALHKPVFLFRALLVFS